MSIGQPRTRVDGPLKVTGAARYTADLSLPGLLRAAVVTATVPAGRITAIEPGAALSEPGVVRVLTHADMPRLAAAPAPPLAQTFIPMQGDEIRFEGQPVAIVLAGTLEAAEAGARRVEVRCERAPALPPAADGWDVIVAVAAEPRPCGFHFFDPAFAKGDAAAALDGAAHRIDAAYLQPSRHHNPMEPSAVIAAWEGDSLTVYDSAQHAYGVQRTLAALFAIREENVRVITRHTGGGFGCKGWVWPHEILAAAAARVAGCPVKLVLRRADMYSWVGYQPRVAQRVGLAAAADGRLAAVTHDVVSLTSVSDDYLEFAAEASKSLYAAPAIRLSQRCERANVAMPTPMRAPVEGPGLWALESAMDELAADLGIDPLDLRLANYAERDPATGKPWSSKKLREAYEEGARLFRWRERPKAAARDGDWLVGQGMASCLMGCFRTPSQAEIRLRRDGSALIRTGTQDIGTGTLTIFPQIAAGILGLAPERVGLEMGDSRLPEAGPTYGSSSTMGVGSAVQAAALDLRGQLARLANISPDEAEMADGMIRRRGGDGGLPLAEALRRTDAPELVGQGAFDPAQHGAGRAMHVFGAVFVEVGVDPELGLLRLRRVVGSYSAGRIVNPLTARSQMIGGIIWGWGMAAMEQSPFDPALGRFLSKNLAGVSIPVSADIPSDITVHFVDEVDEHANPLGARGIGELGATGIAAAVANAVFHATGRRIRQLPITPQKLLA